MRRCLALAFVLLFPQSGQAADAGVYITQVAAGTAIVARSGPAAGPTTQPADHSRDGIFIAAAANGTFERTFRGEAGNVVHWTVDGQARLQVIQRGRGNTVTASQQGTGQRISVWQSGNGNTVVATQSGAGNVAIIVQR